MTEARRGLLAIAAVAVIAFTSTMYGCGAAHRARDQFGDDSTPRPTRTPAPTRTSTPTHTPTPPPPPTATPTPSLPPNPLALHRWAELPVHYCIDQTVSGYLSNADFASFVAQAFATWGVPAVADRPCAGTGTDEDEINEIGWGTPESFGAPLGRLVTEAGLTRTRFSECTSRCDPLDTVRIIEADITIERDPPPQFRTRDCAFSTILHETGHFLGLEHLPAPAVMAQETSDCPADLTRADRAALLARYGERASPQ